MLEKKFYTAKYDRCFKEIMLKENNKDILKSLIESILKIKINDLFIQNTEQINDNIYIKKKFLDILVITDQGKINIELNAENNDYTRPRNMSYLCNLYSRHTLIGHEYNEDVNIIQINLSYGLNDKKDIRKFYIMDNDKKLFVKNFIIIEVNMDFYEKVWYSKDRKEILKDKYFIMLNRDHDKIKEFKEFVDNKVVNKFMDELEKINNDPNFYFYMSEEEDKRKIFNSQMRSATEKGAKNKSVEIAKNLLDLNISIEDISKATNLSIEEIKKIIQN